MRPEGKYIYCIIGTKEERNFGQTGVGDRNDEVTTINFKDIAMVVSSHPVIRLVVNRENTLAHEMVVEGVMEEFTVLPVRFCTIASDVEDILKILERRYDEFKGLLNNVDNKIELSVKCLWKNITAIYNEITEENAEIKGLKEKIRLNKGICDMRTKMSVGELVEGYLKRKKGEDAEKIAAVLKKMAWYYKLNNTIGDAMFVNSAFLVDRGRESEFDKQIDALSEEYKDRIKFLYAGPFPPYNFANISINT
ncbi:MAG: GvpL/GvpF family gas vesicle protein [Nitrospirae bacterium]|nr:GvpL/GvpF family gas vesicle protein [Nitrospirota bacterium]